MAEGGIKSDFELEGAVSIKNIKIEAKIALLKGKYMEARKLFDLAIRSDPHDISMYEHRARTLAALNVDLELALKDINMALKFSPDSGHLYITKVKVLVKMGRSKEDIEDCAITGLKFKPDNDFLKKFLPPVEFVLTQSQLEKIEIAFGPAEKFISLLDQNFQRAQNGETYEAVFDDTIKQWHKDPSRTTGVEVVKDACVIWSGTGYPTEQKTRMWTGLPLIKNFPVSCLIFFEFEDWVAGKSRTIVFNECSPEIKDQLRDMKNDHVALCGILMPGRTCSVVSNQFERYIRDTYKIAGRPKVRRIGCGLMKKTKGKRGVTFRVQALNLNSDSTGRLIHSGMGFCTNLVYEFTKEENGAPVSYAIAYGETVFITSNGCRNLAEQPSSNQPQSTSSSSTSSSSIKVEQKVAAHSGTDIGPLPFGTVNGTYRSELNIELRHNKSSIHWVTSSDQQQDQGEKK